MISYYKKCRPILVEHYGVEQANHIITQATTRSTELCEENKDESEALKAHTLKRIYPSIALFYALLDENISREEASRIIYQHYETFSTPYGKTIQSILKIPGLYRLIPKLFSKMTKKSFGEAAGFKSTWLIDHEDDVQFDMLICPYHVICTKYGCPEITKAFCRTDEICYGNMHPKLHWGRTKTIGNGDECCDFKLTVRK